jgi:NADH dehydrogenase
MSSAAWRRPTSPTSPRRSSSSSLSWWWAQASHTNIKTDEIRFYLIEYANRILPTFPADLAEYATRRLQIHGIEVLTGVGTKSATGTAVELTDGRIIPTSTIVATIGNGPHRLVEALGLDMHWGRIRTDRFMRVPGLDGVWALGDSALIPLVDNPGEDPAHYATQTAQFAVREGRQMADNIIAKIEGKALKPFAYTSKGSLASLGMSKAVADVYGIKLSGTLAWLLWRGFYLSFLPGFAAKFRVGVTWLLNSVMPPNIVQIQSTPPATRYIHYRKGDRVFEPGMLIDGFYTVTKGSFKLTIDNPETGEHFEKVFGPGEHFGERVLLRSALRTGLVVALEDGILLFIAQKDFTRFARAFPFLDQYFKDYIERTFGGTDKSLAPGSANHKHELETLP